MGIKVERILTNNGKEYTTQWGKDIHVFEKHLKNKSIKHKYTKVSHPWTKGFVERFNRTLIEEFY